MTSNYERVMAALELREPDRVPIVEWFMDPSVFRRVCPQATDQTSFEELMDFDAVCVNRQYRVVREYPDGSYVNEWGVRFGKSTQLGDYPIDGPVRTRDDLKALTPPDPDDPYRLGNLPDVVRRFKGKRAIVFCQRVGFMTAANLNGFENFLMNLVEDPEFAHDLIQKVAPVYLRLARNAIRAGADIIEVGDDYASKNGPFCSPRHFRELVQPTIRKMVETVHQEGAKVVLHTDGRIWPILEMLVETGIDGLNPLEPAAGMDLGEVKRRCGRRVCLIGNVDCGRLLSEASPEEVEYAVKECIRQAAPGGGYILSSSNSIHSAVKPENWSAMIAAARRYGSYPISV
jgi:uroporphyrinogen decarboxylase